jgi:HEPN domain-containing protein
MNRNSAVEWLKKVFHDLKSAQILYEANHYTDSIGVDLHYAIEKSFKTFLAYENKKILKTHDLHLLRSEIENYILFTFEEIKIINMATDYHIEESYPQYDRKLPSREEIKEVLEFTEHLFDKVCIILDIEKDELL